ncbi:hypothetical protein ABZP36_022600 [Zizania latifolia]
MPRGGKENSDQIRRQAEAKRASDSMPPQPAASLPPRFIAPAHGQVARAVAVDVENGDAAPRNGSRQLGEGVRAVDAVHALQQLRPQQCANRTGVREFINVGAPVRPRSTRRRRRRYRPAAASAAKATPPPPAGHRDRFWAINPVAWVCLFVRLAVLWFGTWNGFSKSSGGVAMTTDARVRVWAVAWHHFQALFR